MKTNGATWKAYLESWPKGQWVDDSDETYDGVSMQDIKDCEWLPKDDAVVQFTCGVVYKNQDDREGVSLASHFRKWRQSLTHATVVVEIPKNKLGDFATALEAFGAKIK